MAGAGEHLVTLLSAWNEADEDARAAILDEAVDAASFTYDDPDAPAAFEGVDGMAQYLSIIRQSLPDAVLLPMGSPQVSHGTAMVEARLDRNGVPFARLVFVGVGGADGLTRVARFVEGE